MKKIYLLFFIILTTSCSTVLKKQSDRNPTSTENPECNPLCELNQICINTFTEAGSQCIQKPEAPNVEFYLPFDDTTVVTCTHSSGSGSHSSPNAYFALDLASDYDKPASIVRASADGTAYVFNGEDGNICLEPEGTPAQAKPSTCGQSWGNHIRILHSNGYLSFYVHLDHALVKTGDVVHRGDAIGVEGWTGAAGHRHLHWSIQKLPGSTLSEWIEHISWAGTSVPFIFIAQQNGDIKKFDSSNIKCAHAGIGGAPDSQQPRFSGLK